MRRTLGCVSPGTYCGLCLVHCGIVRHVSGHICEDIEGWSRQQANMRRKPDRGGGFHLGFDRLGVG